MDLRFLTLASFELSLGIFLKLQPGVWRSLFKMNEPTQHLRGLINSG